MYIYFFYEDGSLKGLYQRQQHKASTAATPTFRKEEVHLRNVSIANQSTKKALTGSGRRGQIDQY